MSKGQPNCRFLGIWPVVVALGAADLASAQALPQAANPPANPPANEVQEKKEGPPAIAFDLGDWHVRVPAWEGFTTWVDLRYRFEDWHNLEGAGQDGSYNFQHVRFRNGLQQDLGPVRGVFEWQTFNMFGLDPRPSSGPGKSYRDATGTSSPESISVRQLWLEVHMGEANLRAGRQLYGDNGG